MRLNHTKKEIKRSQDYISFLKSMDMTRFESLINNRLAYLLYGAIISAIVFQLFVPLNERRSQLRAVETELLLEQLPKYRIMEKLVDIGNGQTRLFYRDSVSDELGDFIGVPERAIEMLVPSFAIRPELNEEWLALALEIKEFQDIFDKNVYNSFVGLVRFGLSIPWITDHRDLNEVYNSAWSSTGVIDEWNVLNEELLTNIKNKREFKD